jgi:hypothetical protein
MYNSKIVFPIVPEWHRWEKQRCAACTHPPQSLIQSSKNVAKGYSDIQKKVREATSNDSWGPSGSLMAEIAQATHNQYTLVWIH